MSYHRHPKVCEAHATVNASCHECGLQGSFETFEVNSAVEQEWYAGNGWYWWACWPGCLPDSDPSGPFATEAEAIADANDE